jgi:hypothetical protein
MAAETPAMKRRTRTNLIVASLLGAMLVLAWLTQRQADNVRPAFAEFEVATVQVVRVARADGVTLSFERDGAGWRMTAPESRPVDTQRLDGIVNGLNTLSRADYPADRVPLADVGLDPPRAIVVVDGNEFRFGDRSPVSGQRYVQHGSTVHVVDDLVYFRLGGEPGDW